ncbi:MAG: type II secretion system minor pseudopilin GspJ [Pseudomonadota bacterium]
MSNPSNAAGFTLVETLIALSVFALIALGGVALLDITVTSQERLARVGDETRSLQRLQAILRADFGQMVERQSRNEAGALELSAAPQRSDVLLEFASLGRLEDPDDPKPKLQKVRYWLENGSLYRGAFTRADGTGKPRSIALIDQVQAIDIRVFRDNSWVSLAPGASLVPLPQAFELSLAHRIHGPVTLRYLTASTPELPTLQRQVF